jgi:sugar-specific transcriptional regulator TrmB
VTWEREKEWIRQRIRKGIHLNALLTPGKDAALLQSEDPKEMRTTKIFKGKSPFVTGFMLYANKVVIWQPEAPLVVLIEDEFIVQMLRNVFAALWERPIP